MGLAAAIVLLVPAGFAGIILGMRKCYERMPYQWLVIILGFSPFPLAILLFQLARMLRGFIVEP